MTAYYFDSSALIKRYRSEPGSEIVESTMNSPDNTCWTSRLSLVELQSAMMRYYRDDEVTHETIDQARHDILAELRNRRLRVLPLLPYHFVHAGRLLMDHGETMPIRTLDAIQLAAAQDLRSIGRVDILVSADRHMLSVGVVMGFEVLNPI